MCRGWVADPFPLYAQKNRKSVYDIIVDVVESLAAKSELKLGLL